jgi:hypothetical protein
MNAPAAVDSCTEEISGGRFVFRIAIAASGRAARAGMVHRAPDSPDSYNPAGLQQ